MSNIKRSKNFATIVYQESSDIFEVKKCLDSLHISYLISPIHDRDYLESSSDFKKAHYHVVLIFDSLKSVPQVKDILSFKDLKHDYDLDSLGFDFEKVNFVGLEIVNSLTSYARYLCHMDNPEKAQYSVSDVVSFGLDYQQLCHKENDKYDAFGRVIDFIVSTKCTSFARLLLHAKLNDYEMFRALCDNSFAAREFIKSYTLDLRSDLNVSRETK